MTISQTNPEQLRPREDDKSGPIIRVDAGRRHEAIERLVSTGRQTDRAAVERFLHYAATNAVSLDGLWSRLGQNGRITHTILAVPNPGRSAMVFSSHPKGADETPVVVALIDHATCEIAGWNVDLAQALLEPSEKADRAAFLEAGFSELAVLSYLERPLSRSNPPDAPQWPAGVSVESYRENLYDTLVAVLEKTYEQTLDCPGLYGLRRTQDIIAGHKATGQFDPTLWTLLRVDEQPAGVILLNPFPGHRTVELVYLGLAPFARGRGLGQQLLRHGLTLLQGRRERSLTLAVDHSNLPAMSIYQAQGLRPVVQRVALIRSLRNV